MSEARITVNGTSLNSHVEAMNSWKEGQHVEILLHGDEQWYHGIVLDRPRKMWVQLTDYPGGLIADSNNIDEWRASPRQRRSE